MTTSRLRTEKYGPITVFWRAELDGGGRGFGQDFVPVVESVVGVADRVLELCSGPGFIGFSLLAAGRCRYLALADINPAAVSVANRTVAHNGLYDRTAVYLSDALDGVPSTERFDLIIANPPHFEISPPEGPSLLTDDPQWQLHRRLYQSMAKFLAPGGTILFQENSEGSTPETFLPMIEAGGLQHIQTLWSRHQAARPSFYYLWIRRRDQNLAAHTQPRTIILIASDAEISVFDLPSSSPFRFRVKNATTRPIAPELRDGRGKNQLWIPLPMIPPGMDHELPLLALRPGRYEVHDLAASRLVAQIQVAEQDSEYGPPSQVA